VTRKPEIDRQREHQANERTFLAWLRTSVALIGFGFAIARFGLFLRQLQATVTQKPVTSHPHLSSENLGISLVIVGIVTIALAAWRYNQVFWQIERGNYRPNRLMVWLLAAIVIILGILSLPLILGRNLQEPTSPSRNAGKQQSHKLAAFLPKMKYSHHSSNRHL
jgi:putative membrane protein